MKQWIIVRNWERFQHPDVLRTERPAWIKTHTNLLTDDDWLDLTPNRRALLVGLWMLYAASRGQVLSNTRRLSNLLNQRVLSADLEALNQAGFIEFSASKPASRDASKVASLDKTREDLKEQALKTFTEGETRKVREEGPAEEPPDAQERDPLWEDVETEVAAARLLAAIGEQNGNGARSTLDGYELPPAAWFALADDLEQRRDIGNRMGYAVKVFKIWKTEGRYATN